MIKAVIFDMDGLMINSEPIHYEAFRVVMDELGKQFPKEDTEKYYMGLSDLDEAKDMVIRYNISITPEEIVKRKKAVYKKLIETQLTPLSGLIELIQKLHEINIKKAIASSSALEEIKYVIDTLGINNYIAAYCSGEQVEHGKPAPDVFLLAASKLGVDPKDCLILEDSQRGVQAAIAAGMKVFAIPSNETKNGDFSKATRKLNSLSEVFSYLQN